MFVNGSTVGGAVARVPPREHNRWHDTRGCRAAATGALRHTVAHVRSRAQTHMRYVGLTRNTRCLSLKKDKKNKTNEGDMSSDEVTNVKLNGNVKRPSYRTFAPSPGRLSPSPLLPGNICCRSTHSSDCKIILKGPILCKIRFASNNLCPEIRKVHFTECLC